MNLKYGIGGLALALAFVPTAGAQKPAPATPITPPTTATISLDAKPSTLIYSGVTTLSGRLRGRSVRNVAVRLWQDTTRPYGDSYKPTTMTVRTSRNGNYSFAAKPLLNTQYRAVASTSPPTSSPVRLVLVRMLVGIRVSDSTPRRGRLVRFSGSVLPAHDGRRVTIQRRSRTGRFVTVARTTLRDAGTARSSYSRRVRLYRDGVYRVKVTGDGDHINGLSRLRTIDVHG